MGLILTMSEEDLSLLLRLLPTSVKGEEDQDFRPLFPWQVRPGLQVELPSWAARVLEEEGKVVLEEGEHTVRELDRLIHREEITSRPAAMENTLLKWVIVRLRELGGSGSTPELEKMSLAVKELGIKRIAKLMKYAVLSLEYPDIERRIRDRLTIPERVVYGQVREIIAGWLYLQIGRGGRGRAGGEEVI